MPLNLQCSSISVMKNKKSKKFQTKSKIKNQELGQTKNSAKLVLFIFGGLIVLTQGSAVAPFIYTIF